MPCTGGSTSHREISLCCPVPVGSAVLMLVLVGEEEEVLCVGVSVRVSMSLVLVWWSSSLLMFLKSSSYGTILSAVLSCKYVLSLALKKGKQLYSLLNLNMTFFFMNNLVCKFYFKWLLSHKDEWHPLNSLVYCIIISVCVCQPWYWSQSWHEGSWSRRYEGFGGTILAKIAAISSVLNILWEI